LGQCLGERLSGTPGPIAASVNDSCDIVEPVARVFGQRFIGAFLGGAPDEFGHRLPLDGGGALQFLVQIWIKAEASHARRRYHNGG